MAKVNENSIKRYTMRTNARRALKTIYGDAARAAADRLLKEDATGIYFVIAEAEAAQAGKLPAPTATAATAERVMKPVKLTKPEEVAELARAQVWGVTEAEVNAVDEKDLTDEQWEAMQRAELAMLQAETVVVKAAKGRCDIVNGARKPLKGKCAEVWAMGDKLLAANGVTPSLKDMRAAMPSYSPTTVAIQFYAWRKYNGLDA